MAHFTYEVWLGDSKMLFLTTDLEYINYDKLIHLSKEKGVDIVAKDIRTGEEKLRIGHAQALGHNSYE